MNRVGFVLVLRLSFVVVGRSRLSFTFLSLLSRLASLACCCLYRDTPASLLHSCHVIAFASIPSSAKESNLTLRLFLRRSGRTLSATLHRSHRLPRPAPDQLRPCLSVRLNPLTMHTTALTLVLSLPHRVTSPHLMLTPCPLSRRQSRHNDAQRRQHRRETSLVHLGLDRHPVSGAVRGGQL